MFHADPHAGNLLYDERAGQLIVLDWALTGLLTRDQRRHAARLIAAMTFRDAPGVREAIVALSSPDDRPVGGQIGVRTSSPELPIVCSLGAMDAMRLLDRIGMEGVRFPAALVLLRKVMFTLDGVLNDIAGESCSDRHRRRAGIHRTPAHQVWTSAATTDLGRLFDVQPVHCGTPRGSGRRLPNRNGAEFDHRVLDALANFIHTGAASQQ